MTQLALAHARYSEVERRVWNDAWFRSLSPIPPCGAGLWLYFLTTPQLGALPGVIVMGEAAMAEHLKWPLEAFRKVFAEVSGDGHVHADWEARLVIIAKAIGRRKPESPNVIRSWHQQWYDVPECALKLRYYRALKKYTNTLPEGFQKAFNEAITDPSAKAIGNQDQDQDQEQEQDKTRTAAHAAVGESGDSPARSEGIRPGGPEGVPEGSAPPQQPMLLEPVPARDQPKEVWAHYLAGWKKHVRGARPPAWTDKRRGLVRARLREGRTQEDLQHAIDGLWSSAWHIENGHTDFDLAMRDAKHVEQFMAKAPKARTAPESGTRPKAEPAAPPPTPEEVRAQAARVEGLVKGVGQDPVGRVGRGGTP